jgi:flagellar biosynthetic protein FliP
MTSRPTTTARPRSRRRLRFALHYVEMVIAMFVGMALLMPLTPASWAALPAVHALVMAADMTIGMAVWMAVRRHRTRLIAEMSVAMCAPFVLLLVPYALGAISGETVMLAGHLLMFLTMLGAMLLRRDEYAH